MKQNELANRSTEGWFVGLTRKQILLLGIPIAVSFLAMLLGFFDHNSSESRLLAAIISIFQDFIAVPWFALGPLPIRRTLEIPAAMTLPGLAPSLFGLPFSFLQGRRWFQCFPSRHGFSSRRLTSTSLAKFPTEV